MRFQVPQFIEIEDKIFGPLTFKQFVYIGGGLGTAYMIWRLLPLYLAAPLMIADVGFAVALAFLEMNGRPFIVAVESAFYYIIHSKLYLWNNDRPTQATQKTLVARTGKRDTYVPKLSDSRLHELAWSLDVNERIAAGVGNDVDRVQATAHNEIVAPVRTLRSALTETHR